MAARARGVPPPALALFACLLAGAAGALSPGSLCLQRALADEPPGETTEEALAEEAAADPLRFAKTPARRFESGAKWAVVIGVDNYLDRDMPKLSFAGADARLLANILSRHCGYDEKHILLMVDDAPLDHHRPHGINLRQQVGAWLEQAEPGDTVLVFFSGHGFLDQQGRLSLAPKDCELGDLERTGWKAEAVRKLLLDLAASQKVLILDCCHAGSEKNAKSVVPVFEPLSKTFGSARGLITFASCGKDETSKEWDTIRHGLFTHFLAEGLSGAADEDKDAIVDTGELGRYVRKQVGNTARDVLNTRQTPAVLRGAELGGEFALARVDLANEDLIASLDKAVEMLVQETLAFTQKQKQTAAAVSIQKFLGPEGAGGGAALAQNLKTQLQAAGVRVSPLGAAHTLQGKFSCDKRNGEAVLVVEAALVDRAGAEVLKFRRKAVRAVLDNVALHGPNSVDLTESPSDMEKYDPAEAPAPLADERQVAQRVEEALERPRAHAEGAAAFSSDQRLYGLELRKKQPDGAYVSLPFDAELREQGWCKVDLAEKDVFAVALYNRSKERIGVRLTLDGLHVFEYSRNEAWRKAGMMVLPPGEFLIKGWHHQGDASHEFLISRYGPNAARELGSESDIGVVTAAFFELLPPAKGEKPKLFVDVGEEIRQKYTETPADFGLPLGAASVRYLRP